MFAIVVPVRCQMSVPGEVMRGYKIILIHLLNFLDAVLTLIAVKIFGVEEANPFMREALHMGPIIFLASKFVILTVALEYLNKQDFRLRPIVFTVLLCCFLILTAWHVFGLVHYLLPTFY